MTLADDIAAERPLLKKYALKMTRNDDLADDLVQETIVKAITKQHLFEPGTKLLQWLNTILHNEYVNMVRKSVRDGGLVPLEEVEWGLALPATQEKQGLLLRDLGRGLAKMPRERQDVALLMGVTGIRYDAAAKKLGVNVGTVRSRLSRARSSLRRSMAA